MADFSISQIQNDLAFLPSIYPKEMKNKIHVKNKNLHKNVHTSTTNNSQKVETTQIIPINRGTDKENMIYPDNEIFFSRKKELSADTFYYTDEPGKHCAK